MRRKCSIKPDIELPVNTISKLLALFHYNLAIKNCEKTFAHHAFWKRESVGNRRLLPQAKMLLALLKRSGPSVTKHYRKSSHSWTKENLWVKSFTCFNKASSILAWGESRVLLNERAGEEVDRSPSPTPTKASLVSTNDHWSVNKIQKFSWK